MGIDFAINNELMDYRLKEQRLTPNFYILGNATPASKTNTVDIPSVMYLRLQGQTSAVDAIESLSWISPVDNSSGNCVFGVMLTSLGSVSKVKEIIVTEPTGFSSAIVVAPLGVNGLTPGGNIAFNISATGLHLDTESPTFLIKLEYEQGS